RAPQTRRRVLEQHAGSRDRRGRRVDDRPDDRRGHAALREGGGWGDEEGKRKDCDRDREIEPHGATPRCSGWNVESATGRVVVTNHREKYAHRPGRSCERRPAGAAKSIDRLTVHRHATIFGTWHPGT